MAISPYPIKAQVISQDAENDAVYVMTQSGQVLNFPVRRVYPHADGMRMSKPPLPSRGSHILLCFPGGDVRNPMMLGAFHPNQQDPLPSTVADPFSHYESDYSGGYHYMDGISGNVVRQWADNSMFVMGSSLTPPTIFRHNVTSAQIQERIPFPQSERNPKPQQPFAVGYTQATSGTIGGLGWAIDVSGNFSLTAGTMGRTFNVTFNGTNISIDQIGNVSINAGANTAHITAATIILDGFVKLGGAGASTPVAFRGTMDSAGDTLVSDFATKVVAE